MSLAETHQLALRHTGHLVAQVRDDQWELPTPDTDWNVRDLVSHIVLENQWVEPLTEGNAPDEVKDRFDNDPLGDDAVIAYDESAKLAGEAFFKPGVMEMAVEVSFGAISGTEFANQRLLDLVVHGWDLAKATDQDTIIPPELLRTVSEFVSSQQSMLQSSGVFASAVDVDASADEQTRMLAALGRRA